MESVIAAPSHVRCALAAVLLRALPLNVSTTAGLFAQAELEPSESSWSHSAAMCCNVLTSGVPCHISFYVTHISAMHCTTMSIQLQYTGHGTIFPWIAAGIHQVAMMLPVMKSFLEVARRWKADLYATSSLHAYTMCLMRWLVGDLANLTGGSYCTCLVLQCSVVHHVRCIYCFCQSHPTKHHLQQLMACLGLE